MQISEGNVRVITHRGLTKLRARRADRSASELLVSSAPAGIRFAATFATDSDRNL